MLDCKRVSIASALLVVLMGASPVAWGADRCKDFGETDCDKNFVIGGCRWIVESMRCEKGGGPLLRVIELGDLQQGPITEVQKKLNERGGAQIEIDGKFGADTLKAVKEFQGRSGIPITGKVDKATAVKLFAQ